MSEPSANDVALWYLRHGAAGYDLFESEQEAAHIGAYMQEEGEGSILGIQFPDGRLIKREDWAALALAERQLQDEWQSKDAARRSEPPRPTRRILDPFQGQEVTVDDDEPRWLGNST